jgi:hypothetical protein
MSAKWSAITIKAGCPSILRAGAPANGHRDRNQVKTINQNHHTMKKQVKCSKCKKVILSDGFATGYGITAKGKKVCYSCIGEMDRDEMSNAKKGDKFTMYLTMKDGKAKVGNWPSSFVIPVGYVRKGRHNFAGVRYDVWPRINGREFHGVQYGDNTQICHLRCISSPV